MKIRLASVFVQDQERAKQFYVNLLGFIVKNDVPLGNNRWLTVVSPDEPDGAELLLEPNENPAAKAYQAALLEQGISAVAFMVDDIHKEHERLRKVGVGFTMPPMDVGTAVIAVFEDTCGNLVQIYQVRE